MQTKLSKVVCTELERVEPVPKKTAKIKKIHLVSLELNSFK